jgi:hypothetical protein
MQKPQETRLQRQYYWRRLLSVNMCSNFNPHLQYPNLGLFSRNKLRVGRKSECGVLGLNFGLNSRDLNPSYNGDVIRFFFSCVLVSSLYVFTDGIQVEAMTLTKVQY